MPNFNDLKARYAAMKRMEKIEYIGSLLLTLSLLACAVSFIYSAICIYTQGGSAPYSRESVSLYLSRILPISYLTDVLTAATGAISLFNKKKRSKTIPLSPAVLLKLTEATLGDKATEEYLTLKKREEAHRKKLFYISSLGSSAVAATALVFILNPNRYSIENANTDIAYSVVIAATATAIILTAIYLCHYFYSRSYVRTVDAARACIAELQKEGITLERTKEAHTYSTRKILYVRCCAIAVAVLFITLGVFNGGMSDVLGKAVRICTECIGLG